MTDLGKPEPPTPIGVGFKIPVQYWYPTILAVISFTAGGVWWFHNQIEPLESRIAKLEASRPGPAREFPSIPLLNVKHLNGVLLSGELNKDQQRKLDDTVYELVNQRRDLVLIVTGYVGQGKRTGKAEDVKESEGIAQKIKDQLIARGLPANRVFAKGFGQDVPNFFRSRDYLNVALMECDVLVLMRFFASA